MTDGETLAFAALFSGFLAVYWNWSNRTKDAQELIDKPRPDVLMMDGVGRVRTRDSLRRLCPTVTGQLLVTLLLAISVNYLVVSRILLEVHPGRPFSIAKVLFVLLSLYIDCLVIAKSRQATHCRRRLRLYKDLTP